MRALCCALIIGVAGSVALLASPPSAWAEEEDNTAESYDKYYQRAVSYVRKKSYAKAIEYFEKALPFKNDSSDIFYNLVAVCELLKEYEKVHLYAQGFLYLEPDTGDAAEITKKLKVAKKLLAMRKQVPAQVTLTLEPKGTEVTVNYVPLSRGRGASFELFPGTYVARAQKTDYHPWSEQIQVVDDTPVRVESAMKKVVYHGSLVLETVPPEGVKVFLDDQPAGTTPLKEPLRLETKKYLVRLEKEGYDAWLRYVEIKKDETATMKPQLEKSTARKQP